MSVRGFRWMTTRRDQETTVEKEPSIKLSLWDVVKLLSTVGAIIYTAGMVTTKVDAHEKRLDTIESVIRTMQAQTADIYLAVVRNGKRHSP